MLNRFYFKMGIFLGTAVALIGILGFLMRFFIAGDRSPSVAVNYSICTLCGLLVVYTTLRSKKIPRLRYFSRQLQTMLLYIAGTMVLVYSGDLAGLILFIIGLVLAYRYSFMARRMLIITAGYNCVLIMVYARLQSFSPVEVVHELIFIIFSYSILFFIYSDFRLFLNRKINRLSSELDLARRVIPFGGELRKRLESAGSGNVDFTKKEYEVMIALCFYGKVSNEELSEFMSISKATVKTHLHNIYKKTGIHSRSRLITVYKDVFAERRSAERVEGENP